MQSHIGNDCLRKVYYVDVEGSDLMPVPADRLADVGKLRSEQYRKLAEVGMSLSSVRRA